MSDDNISVLIMDDEPSSEIVQVSVDWMEDEGFSVDLVESMSQAVQSYYDKFYDVFVLDIDMSHIPDDEEGDGVNVLKRFISLHNKTKVIMFSGAGMVPHWFAAANAHCFGYIHKNEEGSVKHLIEFIKRSVDEPVPDRREIRKTCPNRILIYNKADSCQSQIRETVAEHLGEKWDIDILDNLADVDSRLKDEKKDDYGIVLLFQDVFELRPDEKNQLKSILSNSPAPQTIIGCQGKDEFQLAILFLANQHPFRMIDTEVKSWPLQLGDALKKAVIWYGQNEIFPADPDALKRMHITLPDDAMEEWEYTSEDMEEFYEASAYDDDEEEA